MNMFYVIFKSGTNMAPRYIRADYVVETPRTITWLNQGEDEEQVVYSVLKRYVAAWSRVNRSIQ